MAWSDIVRHVKFSGIDGGVPVDDHGTFLSFSARDAGPTVKIILDSIQILYEKSPIMARIIDDWVSAGSTMERDIYVYRQPSEFDSQAIRGMGRISINIDIDKHLWWMGVDGAIHKEETIDTIAHELIHALLGRYDQTNASRPYSYGDSDYNFMGPTQLVANAVLNELGYTANYQQAGYNFTFIDDLNQFSSAFSYTEGKTVSGAVHCDSTASADLSTRLQTHNQ